MLSIDEFFKWTVTSWSEYFGDYKLVHLAFWGGGVTGMMWVKTPRLHVFQKRAPEQGQLGCWASQCPLSIHCALLLLELGSRLFYSNPTTHKLALRWSMLLFSCSLPSHLSVFFAHCSLLSVCLFLSLCLFIILCIHQSLSSLLIQLSFMERFTIPSRAADGEGFRMDHSKEAAVSFCWYRWFPDSQEFCVVPLLLP